MVAGHTLLSVERWTLGIHLCIGGKIYKTYNGDLPFERRFMADKDWIWCRLSKGKLNHQTVLSPLVTFCNLFLDSYGRPVESRFLAAYPSTRLMLRIRYGQ